MGCHWITIMLPSYCHPSCGRKGSCTASLRTLCARRVRHHGRALAGSMTPCLHPVMPSRRTIPQTRAPSIVRQCGTHRATGVKAPQMEFAGLHATTTGYGRCGTRDAVQTHPPFHQIKLSASARLGMWGRVEGGSVRECLPVLRPCGDWRKGPRQTPCSPPYRSGSYNQQHQCARASVCFREGRRGEGGNQPRVG